MKVLEALSSKIDQKEISDRIVHVLKNDPDWSVRSVAAQKIFEYLSKRDVENESLKQILRDYENEVHAIIGDTANTALRAIRDRDMNTLASLVHPEEGVLMSPWPTPTKDNPHFLPEEVQSLPDDETIYQWTGSESETGIPLESTGMEYLEKWMYNFDYLEEGKAIYNNAYNPFASRALHYIPEKFPNTITVSYYAHDADDPFSGTILRLIFKEYKGQWKLIAISNHYFSW
jgi:hypothetical protein